MNDSNDVNNENIIKSDLKKNLSDRELEVIKWLMIGATNKEIGEHMGVTPHTVKAHIASILRKTGTKNRLEAAMFCYSRGVGCPNNLTPID